MGAYHEIPTYMGELPIHVSKYSSLSFLAHWHNDIEIVYVYEGSLRMGINFQTRILHAGEFGICGSGDVHFYDSKDLSCNAIVMVFSTKFIGSAIRWPEDTRLAVSFVDKHFFVNYKADADFSKNVGRLLLDIFSEITNKRAYYQIFIKSKLLELHGLLMRNVPQNECNTNLTKTFLRVNRIQNALDYMHSNYMEPLTITEVAAIAELGVSQFSKVFKKLCRMTFVTYLSNLRVSKAEHMLTNSNASITDIALECGFNSVRNFNRTFKAVTEFTPSSMKKGFSTKN